MPSRLFNQFASCGLRQLQPECGCTKFANRELRTLWNTTLRKSNGYEFGHRDETISSVLGKNKRAGTLSKAGICLAYILDKLDNNHCINSIDDTITWELKQN